MKTIYIHVFFKQLVTVMASPRHVSLTRNCTTEQAAEVIVQSVGITQLVWTVRDVKMVTLGLLLKIHVDLQVCTKSSFSLNHYHDRSIPHSKAITTIVTFKHVIQYSIIVLCRSTFKSNSGDDYEYFNFILQFQNLHLWVGLAISNILTFE